MTMLNDNDLSAVSFCIENFHKFREESLRNLQIAINQGEFIIHPKMIARNWLNPHGAQGVLEE